MKMTMNGPMGPERRMAPERIMNLLQKQASGGTPVTLRTPMKNAAAVRGMLLAKPNKRHNNGPIRAPRHDLKHQGGLALVAPLLQGHLCSVPGSLGFVENHDVLRGQFLRRLERVVTKE